MVMEKKVREYIIENQLIMPGDKLVLGLSGGADSVCLFFLLLAMREELSFEFCCVHVHHGIRGVEADEDEAYVRALCEKHGILYESFYYKVEELARERGCSTEEMGRILRYETFERVLVEKDCNKIAVAHHMADQAETVLYHLCRGSGLAGLSGMRPRSENRIRPLLCVKKEEITAYLTARGIAWREDATNTELHYTRNRIRNQVLPVLTELVNPASVEHIAATAEILSETGEFIRRQTETAWKACARTKGAEAANESEVSFLLESFTDLDIVLQKQLIFMALDFLGKGKKDLQNVHLKMILKLKDGQSGRGICLPDGVRVSRVHERLLFSVKSGEVEKWEPVTVISGEYELPDKAGTLIISKPVPVEEIPQKEIVKNRENSCTKWFDYDKIKDTLQLRNRMEGDYLEFSESYLKKKLKSYMIDEKIPKQERDKLWLLADGSHILWVIGYRISERYKIKPDTTQAIKAEIKWR